MRGEVGYFQRRKSIIRLRRHRASRLLYEAQYKLERFITWRRIGPLHEGNSPRTVGKRWRFGCHKRYAPLGKLFMTRWSAKQDGLATPAPTLKFISRDREKKRLACERKNRPMPCARSPVLERPATLVLGKGYFSNSKEQRPSSAPKACQGFKSSNL